MNLFKPIMVVVNNAIVVINQFAKAVGDSLGKILGWRYEVGSGAVEMEDMAEFADDTATGLGNAGKAAKELKRQLQGFDELNNLTSPDDNSGGGSGGSGGGLGGASGASNMAGKWVKEESLFESDWDTWFKLGRGISEAWTEGLNSIDWDSVYSAFDDFGTNLASFLNGLITPDLFGAVGKTIAGSLNSALHFLNSFGTTFDWKNFGNSLATGVNNFFSTFDFQLAGKAISEWIKGALDACIEFIDKTDFEKIGEGIADFISNLDIPNIVDKMGTLAVKLIEALGEAIIGLGENNPLAASIVGLLAITKLVGFGTALGTAVEGATKGQKFSLKNTAIGILVTIGSVGLLNSYDNLTGLIASAAGIAIGGKMIGLPTKYAVGLGIGIGSIAIMDEGSNATSPGEYVAKKIGGAIGVAIAGKAIGLSNALTVKLSAAAITFSLVGDITESFASWLTKQLGNEDLSDYYANFHWFGDDGFFDTVFQDITDVPQAWYDMWNDFWDWVAEQSMGAITDIIDWFIGLYEEVKQKLAELNPFANNVDAEAFMEDGGSYVKNIGVKLGIELPTDTEQEGVKTTWDKISNFWKDKEAEYEVDPNKTSKSTIQTAFGERSGIWSDKKSAFSVDATKTKVATIIDARNTRQNVWTGKWANFAIDSTITKVNDIITNRNTRQNVWTGKTANYSVNTSATNINAVVTANSAYQSKWTDKVANYAIKFGVDAEKVKTFINSDVFGKINGVFAKIPILKGFSIPYMATGGVIDNATVAMIGESGTEAVVPLERNTQWLGKMAGMIANEIKYDAPSYNGSVYTPASITARVSEESTAEQNALLREEVALLRQIANKELTISEREVFNATRNASNNYYNRTGNSPFVF